MKSYQIIFHIDMNCFFASCEIVNNPSLKGKPVVVAPLDPLRRGIILSPSYEARRYNIKTTMKVKEALVLCPNLVVVEPNYELYQQLSNKFFTYLHKYTNIIEPASIDEAYIDMSEICDGTNTLSVAKRMQDEILSQLGLPVSIGIAPNKFLAKMASDMKKPLGITVLRKREIDKLMWPLDVSEQFGIGKKTAPRLYSLGIKTIGDLANFKDMKLLEKTFGEVSAKSMVAHANGIDNSKVVFENLDEVSSVSNSYTFDHNTKDEKLIKTTLKVLANTVCYRMQEMKKECKTIGIQLKYDDFTMVNRSYSLNQPSNDEHTIYRNVETLYDEYYEELKDIRLVGVFANRLVDERKEVVQYTIFDDLTKIEKDHEVDTLLKRLQMKFGNDSIKKYKDF